MECTTRLPSLISLVMVVGLMSFPLTVQAVKPASTPPGNHLNITEVEVNFDTSMIVSTGEHFSFGNTLEVTLGEFGPLNIVTTSDTEIVVDFPAGGFLAGVKDYLLTVSTGTGQSQNDEYDLTIGANGTLAMLVVEAPHDPTVTTSNMDVANNVGTVDQTQLETLCADVDGCTVRLLLTNFTAQGEPTPSTAPFGKGPALFFYNASSREWRMSTFDTLSISTNFDGENGPADALTISSNSCLFTDGEYIKGSTALPTDTVVGFDLVNFGLPSDTHGCVLVFTD